MWIKMGASRVGWMCAWKSHLQLVERKSGSDHLRRGLHRGSGGRAGARTRIHANGALGCGRS